MIAPPGNTQIWIAAGVTDLRRGFTGLSALVQTKLEQIPSTASTFKEEKKAQPRPISISYGSSALSPARLAPCVV